MSESDHSLTEALAKFGLPRLPASLARWLEIELEKLDEELRFAGDAHQYWLTTPIRAESAAQSSVLADLEAFYGGFFFDEATKLPIRNQQEYDAARNAVVGFKPAIALIIGTHQKAANAYYLRWEKNCAPYEAFHAQLGPIKEFAIARSRARWSGREDWFDNTVLPHTAAKLESEATAWRDMARDIEQKRLVSGKPARKRRAKKTAGRKADPSPPTKIELP
jgi:hypothetical protein